MVGITSFGAYIPFLRMNMGSVFKGGKGEKALANFDEDSVTMAVAAVMDCLRGGVRDSVDGLFFGSTTFPYREKQGATTIAVAADLREDIITADFANSTKAGTNALRSAADAVTAGTARQVMVTAADIRLGPPGSASEQVFGDGAAALLIGKDNVIASLEGSYSVCLEIMDTWRIKGAPFVRSWEARFAGVEGYQKTMQKAVSGVLKKTGLRPEDFARVVFYTPNARSSGQLAGRMGFDPKSQLQNPLFGVLGNTGAPYSMMLMVAALEESQPGDNILLANYGNGADAFVFNVTDRIKDMVPYRGIKHYLSSKLAVEDYRTYLHNRRILPELGPNYPVPFGTTSAPALFREVDKNLRFHAVKCDGCGTVQYPPQRVCAKCHSKDKFRPVRLSDKKGKIFTFSMDAISSMFDSPVVVAVVDFDGGGRMECTLTDRVAGDVRVGMEVEMTFRRLFEREEIINYFWKAMPVRF
ncbi:MAG: OB-fold domain-containing protein [Thermodesulfobacteriota bacterium]|nr:OB-fold domain-containing protein [Thermodesulfobacteriota bacterium]